MVNELDYISSISSTLEKGSWVAVVDNKVVASGKDSKEVYSKAKQEYPSKIPFITKVPSEVVMLM